MNVMIPGDKLLEVTQELSMVPDAGVVKGLAKEAIAKAVKSLETKAEKLEKEAAQLFMVPHREQLNILARAHRAAAGIVEDRGEDVG